MASLLRATTDMVKKLGGKVGGKISIGHAVNTGMDLGFKYMDYTTARKEGNGVIASIGNAVAEEALPMIMGPWGYAAYIGITELPSATVSIAESYDQYGRQLAQQSTQRPFNNVQFTDTQQVYTMRQAGMALAQKSKYSLQQTMLGNEAKYMHR